MIRRSQNKLYVLRDESTETIEFAQEWDCRTPLQLPNGQTLTMQDLFQNKDLQQKFSAQILTVKLGLHNHGRKAKKIFQQFAIPPWERHKYPLVFTQDRLICVVGLWVSGRLG